MNSIIKEVFIKILPKRVYSRLVQSWGNYQNMRGLKAAYKYDLKHYTQHSDTFASNTSTKALGTIIKYYHVIEKGLTMPETRLGFGQRIVVTLIQCCLNFIQKYGEEEEQLTHAIQVIFEYKHFHSKQEFNLEKETYDSFRSLENTITNYKACSQIQTTKEEYFKHTNEAFPDFANSRGSIRNYTKESIPLKSIIDALEISKKTPSACNRQAWRTYLYTNKQQINRILEAQEGNRGFGELSDKLIVITAELGLFSGAPERYQAYVDGGMYAMSLLYSIHYKQIAACILNCSHNKEKDIKLRHYCGIRESEVFIAMIVCGYPPETFKIPISKRNSIEITNNTL